MVERMAQCHAGPGRWPAFACLTGGPGTGKTTTLREMIENLARRFVSVACAAPSGKAAMRMAEATGAPASTIHRLLKIQPGNEGSLEPIARDVLILDEASMIDSRLAAKAIQAARAGVTRLVLLVGDSDQLPPVGPGQPFHDLIQGLAPERVARLTQPMRQAQQSGIVRAAYAVRDGEEPDFNDSDFRFQHAEDDTAGAVVELLRELPDAQVLAPTRKGPAGVEALNEIIERSRGEIEGGSVRGFRLGSRVINVRNNYDANVWNGECGIVTALDPDASARKEALSVDFGGASDLLYRGAGIGDLQPAWALTVHKSQGSEWADVIVIAHPSHSYSLTRRLLYVAITRAKRRVVVVGTRGAVAQAVRNTRDARRDTWLGRKFARDRKAGA